MSRREVHEMINTIVKASVLYISELTSNSENAEQIQSYAEKVELRVSSMVQTYMTDIMEDREEITKTDFCTRIFTKPGLRSLLDSKQLRAHLEEVQFLPDRIEAE